MESMLISTVDQLGHGKDTRVKHDISSQVIKEFIKGSKHLCALIQPHRDTFIPKGPFV